MSFLKKIVAQYDDEKHALTAANQESFGEVQEQAGFFTRRLQKDSCFLIDLLKSMSHTPGEYEAVQSTATRHIFKP